MDRDQVEKKASEIILSFLAQRGRQIEPAALKNLRAIGIDSLSMAELIFEICEGFGIDDKLIDDARLRSINSLDTLVEVLQDVLPLRVQN